MDAKSDLYIYFYFGALSLLNSAGSFCFITSTSWLDVGYGADLQEFLLRHAHVKIVIDNRVRRSFATADVNTVIVLLSAADDHSEVGLTKTARFVMFYVPFEEVLSAIVFDEIDGADDKRTTKEYRLLPLPQSQLLAGGSESLEDVPTESTTGGRRPAGRGPLIKVARYIGDKWGGKYLRAPDIYWTIVEKGRENLVTLGAVADVRPGCYSGINDFFYLRRSDAEARGIEADCLRPIVRSSRNVEQPLIRVRQVEDVVFFCPLDKADLKRRGYSGALRYITWGEQQVTRERQKTAAGIPWPRTETVRRRAPGWWAIPEQNVEPCRNFLLYVIGERFLAPWSDRPIASDRCFHRLFVPAAISVQLAAAVNSTVTFLMMSLFGRGNLGQGAQKYETTDAKRLAVVDPMRLSLGPHEEEIVRAFGSRRVLPISEELRAQDRRQLDRIVFETLRLTRGEVDALYEAVNDLVTARLQKAESLHGKERRRRIEAVESTQGIWADGGDTDAEEEE